MATLSPTGALVNDVSFTETGEFEELFQGCIGANGYNYVTAPEGHTNNAQNFSVQDLPSTAMAQDAGVFGDLSDPFTTGEDIDLSALPPWDSEHSHSAILDNAVSPEIGDNQANPNEDIGSSDQTAAVQNMNPSTTGQSTATATPQPGTMSGDLNPSTTEQSAATALMHPGSVPVNQHMGNLAPPDARLFASTYFTGVIGPIMGPINGVQQTTLKQTRESLPSGYSTLPCYALGAGVAVNNSGVSFTEADNEDFFNRGNNYVNNAPSNLVGNAPGNHVDNVSRSSHNATPTDQAASMLGNVTGVQDVSSNSSQKSTPPSQPVYTAGGLQGTTMPANQVDRNRSSSGSSGNSGTSQKCKASSPGDQITGNPESQFTGHQNTESQLIGHQMAGNQFTGNQMAVNQFAGSQMNEHQFVGSQMASIGNQITGFTHQQGTQVYQGIFPSQQVACQNGTMIQSSPETGSEPMHSSPAEYLPGQLGAVEEFNQGISSGSSRNSVQQNSPSDGHYAPPGQGEATFPIDISGQPVMTAQAPVHNPQPSPVSLMDQLMNPEAYNVDCGTLYSSVEEARAARPVQDGVREDSTLPTNDLQKQAIVRALTKAMLSFKNAEDNPGMIKPFKEGKYSAERVECVCWEILDCVITRQISGSLLAAHGLKRKITSDLLTFAERMTKILDCLETQKTICKHLLDAPYMHQFVDDPQAAQKRVIANKTLNKRKGEVMNAGKQVLGARKAAESTTINQAVRVAAATMSTAPAMPTMTTVPPVNNAGAAMTPNNTPGNIAATGRNPLPATPSNTSQQMNIMASANKVRYQTAMSAGTPTPVPQVRPGPQGYQSVPLNRVAAAQAYNNRMMGATSHPRQNAGSVTMPPTAQASPHPYNPEQTINTLLGRNLMVNYNQLASQSHPYSQMGYPQQMGNPVQMGHQPRMGHQSQMGHQPHMGHQAQMPGPVSGTRKRRREETDVEDDSPSAKRQH
ncbi:uncharacterized protein AtWU_06407 [Aspergillus tubingensis]|uniref:Similar to An11g00630 n=1 Tax=Aspergillus niger TaxID=5061 RepID=A0A100IIQ7_ASPNG|nr:guanine nucleotide-binding protein negative regulator 1 [Aspergillus tubingensis]GAQ42000.1 similar to An11g00630 [Aspergillus niger]GFN16605.1 guanine nucleotide-binding protein negative regulator 1 [Aspergillus tubingensis]